MRLRGYLVGHLEGGMNIIVAFHNARTVLAAKAISPYDKIRWTCIFGQSGYIPHRQR